MADEKQRSGTPAVPPAGDAARPGDPSSAADAPDWDSAIAEWDAAFTLAGGPAKPPPAPPALPTGSAGEPRTAGGARPDAAAAPADADPGAPPELPDVEMVDVLDVAFDDDLASSDLVLEEDDADEVDGRAPEGARPAPAQPGGGESAADVAPPAHAAALVGPTPIGSLPTAVSGAESSGILVVPDVDELAAASVAAAAREAGPLLDLEIVEEPVSLDDPAEDPGARGLSRVPTDVGGRTLKDDGLPELSGLFSLDMLDRELAAARARPTSKRGPADASDPFEGDLPPEPELGLALDVAPPEPWRPDEIAAAVPEQGPAPVPVRAYWREQIALYEEQVRQGEPGEAAAAALSAAALRAAARIGGAEAIAALEQRSTKGPVDAAALRAGLRLRDPVSVPAEIGDAVRLLAETAPHPEDAAGWAWLGAAWRATSGDAPAGGADLVFQVSAAEAAMAAGAPAGIAASLEGLVRALGGEVAATLRRAQLRVRELGDDLPAGGAAAPGGSPGLGEILEGIRGACRLSASEGIGRFVDLAGAARSPALRTALFRWAAILARASGDLERAAALGARALLDGEPSLLPLLDRLALVHPAATAEALAAASTVPPGTPAIGRAALDRRLADVARARGDAAEALTGVRRGLPLDPVAPFVAEAVAAEVGEPGPLREALRLWAAGDPARRADALVALATALEGDGDAAGDPQQRIEALREACAARPGDPAFWTLAWTLAEAGRTAEAADVLEHGANQWHGRGGAPVAVALRERAEVLRALESPSVVVARSPALAAAASRDDGAAAVVRGLLGGEIDPPEIAARFCRAAAGSERRTLEAVGWLLETGAGKEALALLLARQEEGPLSQPARRLLRRLVRLFGDPLARVAVLDALVGEPGSEENHELLFQRAEALEVAGQGEEAEGLYRDLLAGRFALDADVALRRVLWTGRNGAALEGVLRDEVDGRVGAGQSAAAARALLEKARVAADLGRDDGAAAAAHAEALTLDPGLAEARLALLLHTAASGDRARTIELLGAFAERDAPSLAPATTYVLVLLESAVGRPGAALELARAEAARAPEIPIALARLCLELQLAKGDWPGAAGQLEALAERLIAAPDDSRRLASVLAARAAELRDALGAPAHAEALLERAVAAEPDGLPGLVYLARLRERREAWDEAADLFERRSQVLRRPANQRAAYLRAATIAELQLQDPRRATELFQKAMAIDPASREAFEGLRRVFLAAEDLPALAELLASRAAAVQAQPEESAALRLERAELLIGPLADRAGAKAELRALLATNPQHVEGLGRLAGLEFEDGAYAVAAELYIRQARFERDPSRLKEIFLRIGRIYSRRLSDPKLAMGAYERVLQIDPGAREGLEALSDLYAKHGEPKKAIAVTERLLEQETEPGRRLPMLLRLATLWEKGGDPRRSSGLLKRAAEESPRSLQAVGELARFYERTKEAQARNVLLDGSIALLREDLRKSPSDLSALRTLVPLLRWRQRNACSAAAAQLLGMFSDDPSEQKDAAAWAAPPREGRRLAPLANPELEERIRPVGLPVGILNVMRLVGPALSRASRPDVKRFGVGRSDRVPPGTGLRLVFDPLAADLGVRGYDLYVGGSDPWGLALEPGETPALVVGHEIAASGPPALRFVGGYALRLLETHLAPLLRDTPEEMGALLVAIVRQFVPDFSHPAVQDEAAVEGAARVGRILSGRVARAELAPFVAEIAAPAPLPPLHLAIQEAGARAGLVAGGDLAAALTVIGRLAGRPATLTDLLSLPLGAALVDFALSDEHQEIVSAVDAVS